MQRFIPVFASLAMLISVPLSAAEKPRPAHPETRPSASGTVVTIIDENGRIVVRLPGEPGSTGAENGIPVHALPGHGSDLLIDPHQAPFISQRVYPQPRDIVLPPNRPPDLNGLSVFFSSATGGIGFRIGYDRRLSPIVRLMGGIEMLTYGYQQSAARLGSAMPYNVSRITLVSLPVGLQRQFAADKRIVPHIGFGAGPILRFDHQTGPPGFYPRMGIFNAGFDIPYRVGYYNGLDFSVGLPFEDFPRLSLTVGGFVTSGIDIRLGENRDFALSLGGRYTLAHFTDMLGSPGDFSGFSIAIGLGKYF